PIDVALGDPVGRVEGERLLVVLARGAELALLPEGLGEAILGLRVVAELEELPVRVGGGGPLAGRGLADRLLGELALQPGRGDGAVAGLDVGEGHGWIRSFRCAARREAARSR